MPIAITIARRDTRLKEKPASLYRMGEAARAMGTAKMTEKAVLGLPRNKRTMMATTIRVIHSSWKVLSIEARMAPVLSMPGSTL